MRLALTDHLVLASPVSLSDEPLHVCCPINNAALSFPCFRVRLYRYYEKLHKYLGKTLWLFFLIFEGFEAVFSLEQMKEKQPVRTSLHFQEYLSGQTPGKQGQRAPCCNAQLCDSTNKSCHNGIAAEKHGGQNGISLCVPALFSRLEGLPPKRAYRGSQTEKTDTFICLNPYPTLPSFHPAVFFPLLRPWQWLQS